jgi:hypothetical protein
MVKTTANRLLSPLGFFAWAVAIAIAYDELVQDSGDVLTVTDVAVILAITFVARRVHKDG